MRKVTASAVILTAITGCSQNEAPSAQWSFDPPTVETAAFTAGETQTQLRDPVIDSLSPEAQKFLNQTGGQASVSAQDQQFSGTMGPAFEQPQVEVPTTPQDTVVPVQTQRRTDPIAEVRAYLNRTRVNSFLGDRVPYSAQVELPAAPNYTTSIYSQQTAIFEEVAPVAITEQASLDQASISAIPTLNDAAQTVASLGHPPAQFSTSDLLAAVTQTPLEAPLVSGSPVEVSPSTPSPQLTSYGISQNTLPALRPAETGTTEISAAQPSSAEEISPVAFSDVENRVAEAGSSSDFRDEHVSIGTAILNDLRRNQEIDNQEVGQPEGEYAESEYVESEEFTVAVASDKPLDNERTVTEEHAVTESTDIEQTSFESRSLPSARVGIEPMVVSDRFPTDEKLARLLRTLPQQQFTEQTEAPLLSHFQASQEAPHQISMGESVETSQTIETRESKSAPSLSLLLEGLRETAESTSALQTLYMPIPEAPLSSASAALIQTALETLGSNANTAALVNELTTESSSSEIDTLGPSSSLGESMMESGHLAQLVRVDSADSTSRLQNVHTQQKRQEKEFFEGIKALQSDRLSDNVNLHRAEKTLSSSLESRQHIARYRQRIVWQ